jgi:sorting nexin-25
MQQQQRLILACLGVLVLLNTAATTWLPSLRLIIWAFFLGSLLAVLLVAGAILLTSDNNAHDHVSTSPLRQIKPLGFTVSTTWRQEVAASLAENNHSRKPLYPASEAISQALDAILRNVNRDFIASWYSAVSPDPSFTLHVDNVVRHAVERVTERLQTLDVAEVLVGRIAPLLTAHLHDFSAAERAVRGRHLDNNLTESEELDLAIAKKYRDGKLHAAASLGYSDMKQAQQDHLRKLADRILPLVLPEKEARSKVVSIIAREIIACAVLFPALVMLSDPDTWNRIIEALVGGLDTIATAWAHGCV